MKKLYNKKFSIYITLLLSLLILLPSCLVGQTTLSKTGELGYKIPVVYGIDNAKEYNEQLKNFFESINNSLKSSQAAELGIELDYSIIPNGENHTLKSWIANKEGHKLSLEGISISSKGISLPQLNFLNLLSDRAFLERSFWLTSKGYEINLFELEKPINAKKVYSLFTIYYEDHTQSKIDFNHVNRSDINDVFHLKALGIIPELLQDYYPSDSVNIQDYLHSISLLVSEILFDSYGLSSDGFTSADLENAFILFSDLSTLSMQDNEKLAVWNNFRANFSKLLQSGITEYGQKSKLSRENLASIFSFLFQEYFYNQNREYFYPDFVDGFNENASFCVGQQLMDGFPKYSMFYPDYISKFHELPALTNTFVTTCFNENFLDYLDQNIVLFSESAAIKSLDLLDQYFDTISQTEKNKNAKFFKINDKDYNWHLRQYESGEYADVNCMPTMAAMAIKWVNKNAQVSAEQLRNLFLPDYNDGWWMAQVIGCLNEFNVSHEYYKISASTVIDIINRGGIVLAMFSESEPGAQGHCEIIYGYKKVGDSLHFLVNDPGFDNEYRPDGNPKGKARWIDASYLIWTVERINDMILSVGTK